MLPPQEDVLCRTDLLRVDHSEQDAATWVDHGYGVPQLGEEPIVRRVR